MINASGGFPFFTTAFPFFTTIVKKARGLMRNTNAVSADNPIRILIKVILKLSFESERIVRSNFYNTGERGFVKYLFDLRLSFDT